MNRTRQQPPVEDELRQERIGRLRWLIRPALWAEPLRPVLERPDAFLGVSGQVYKHSRNVSVAGIPGTAADEPGWVLRRLNYGKAAHRIRDALRRSRARRALAQSAWLEAAGVATARVVAAADDRRLGWPRRGYVLSERIPEATTLAQRVRVDQPVPRAEVARLAALLARLHDHRLSHRDLKGSNVLFDGRGHPFLIDLDGVRRVRFAARARALSDLVRLAREVQGRPSVPVRLAALFLNSYCRCRRLPDWRWWWRAIERRLSGRP